MNPPASIAKIARSSATEVEDVQAHADTRRLPINRVGIKDISHPVRVKDRSAGEQHTIASFNMYVSLPHNFKGTHMSRFVEILHAEREISVESFGKMLTVMTERLEASTGHIEMSFPFFVTKRAPVSGVESLMDYRASLIGEHRDRSRACAPARRRSPLTARTTSARTSRSPRSCAVTCGSRSSSRSPRARPRASFTAS
jgi:GTP cyclohydrolase FolE2